MGTLKKYEVGGCVRDDFMGLKTKDIDFAVEASSYEEMLEDLVSLGFKIHQESPEHFTVRCGIPKDSPLYQRAHDADFVLCRKDAPTGDGRRPDWVEAGTIWDDLARRDFTVNSIARDPETGTVLDPNNGQWDIKRKVLRFVGDPNRRIGEDGLRVLRGYRFWVTKSLIPEKETRAALKSQFAAEMLKSVSVERIEVEIEKMMKFDTIRTIHLLEHEMPPEMVNAIFRDGLWLKPTLKGKKQ